PACILYSGTTHLVESDGTIETVTHEITRLNGRKGIDKLGEYHNITYAPPYQKLTLNVARVLKANGAAVPIEAKHVQLRDHSTDRLSHWHVEAWPPLPQDDNLPSKEELRLHLACSTFASWEEVGRWKARLRSDCWTCSPALRKIVLDVTRGLTTPEEKARA